MTELSKYRRQVYRITAWDGLSMPFKYKPWWRDTNEWKLVAAILWLAQRWYLHVRDKQMNSMQRQQRGNIKHASREAKGSYTIHKKMPCPFHNWIWIWETNPQKYYDETSEKPTRPIYHQPQTCVGTPQSSPHLIKVLSILSKTNDRASETTREPTSTQMHQTFIPFSRSYHPSSAENRGITSHHRCLWDLFFKTVLQVSKVHHGRQDKTFNNMRTMSDWLRRERVIWQQQ